MASNRLHRGLLCSSAVTLLEGLLEQGIRSLSTYGEEEEEEEEEGQWALPSSDSQKLGGLSRHESPSALFSLVSEAVSSSSSWSSWWCSGLVAAGSWVGGV